MPTPATTRILDADAPMSRLQEELTSLRAWRDEATVACAKRRCSTMQRDRDEAEAQVAAMRGTLDDLLCLAKAVAEHFQGTDAPIGCLARMLLENDRAALAKVTP